MKKILLILFCFSLLQCNEVKDLGIVAPGKEVVGQKCKITRIGRSDGLFIEIAYNGDKPTNFKGIEFFDQLIYDGDKLVGAKKGNVANYDVKFELNKNNQIKTISVSGRNAAGIPYKSVSTLTYDSKDRLSGMVFSLPIFTESVEISIEYNKDNNITKIFRKVDGKNVLLVENLTFDEKPSPFKDNNVGNILSYFMIYNLLVGDTNYSYYLSTNNITSSVIYNNNGTIEISSDYEYDDSKTTRGNMSKSVDGRIRSVTESYTYFCE